MSKALRYKWARKLTKAKYFVVLTDKESVISLEGVQPEDMHDVLALQSQAVALQDFYDRLGELIKAHTNILDHEHGGKNAKKTSVKKTASRRKKIPVKEG